MATQPMPQQKLVAPYVPFKSFMTALDHLRHGPPLILDRSVWPTFSGGLAGQMIAAFRFLGFINEEHEVQSSLYEAINPDQRQATLAKAMRTSYEDLYGLDLSRATPKQLSDVLSEEYNVIGSTHKKALTFFLHAAKYTDTPLSPAISRKSRTSAPRKRRVSSLLPPKGDAEDQNDISPPPPPPKVTGSSRTISLKGGGSATLAFDVDVWSMTPEDQQFVFEMIRKMNEYEQAKSIPPDTPTDSPISTS